MSAVLFHIGYSKAGSTFLKNWFTEHPEILLGGFKTYEALSTYVENIDEKNSKELFVLSNHIFNLFKWDFKQPLDSWMAKSGLYEYQGNMCSTIHSLFPNAKVLFVTRGYYSILKSFYSEYIRTGGRYTCSGMIEEHGDNFLQKTYNYNYLITLYIKKIGKENVIALPYEQLKNDPDQFLRNLEKSLNLNYYDFSKNSINPSLENGVLYWYRYFSNFVFKLSRLLGHKGGNALYGLYTKLLLNGYFYLFAKALSRLFKRIEVIDLLPQQLDKFRNKASVLKEFPCYKEHYEAYLIDQSTPTN